MSLWTTVLGYTAGALVAVLQIPQVVTVCRRGNANGVSRPSISLHTINSAMWITYGLLLGETPIVMANVFYLGANLIILRYSVLRTRPATADAVSQTHEPFPSC